MSKLWHNTTAHYNGYFNANELLFFSEQALVEQHQDNYNKILPVYEYIEADNPQAVAEDLDEAVRKVTIVVNLHPYSNWTDDCYLLAGRAFYLKQDYEGAEKTFRYLINEFPPEPEVERSSGKSNNNRNRRNRSSSRNNNSQDQTGEALAVEGEEPKSRRELERERKRYNREVRRRKKRRNNNNNRNRNRQQEQEQPTATDAPQTDVAETTPETEEGAAETETAPTRVRLSDNTEAAIAADPDSYFLKHRPAFQEGMLWLGRTLIERDNYDAAARVLNQLLQNPGTFDDVRREAAAAQAHLAIKQRDYDAAVPALERAIELANKRDRRARYSYILAQVHQHRGNSQAALAAFEQVLKNSPDYTMEFASRLNMAQNSYLSGQGSAAEAMANLERMLKDSKNAGFHDQIYFAMAEIALAQGDREQGVALLQKSLSNSLSNRAQKAEAYYMLGTLSYEQEEYLAAKLYFDSTLTVMGPADERFVPTERLRDNLVDIAAHIQTIALQDSLLAIAELSPEEQAELAKDIFDAQRQSAAAASGIADDKFNRGGLPTASRAAGSSGRPGAAPPALRNESNFFAYDDRAVRRGQREFSRRWGDRRLEDNWRRSNRRDASGFDEDIAVETTDVNLLTQDQINDILGDVPQDENGKETARLAIKQAMYELGRLYRDRLDNNEKAVEVLEELNTRFPGNIHELDSWYYLYLSHTDLGNSSDAQRYRDLIIDKYPTSNYGRILQDPNYAEEYLSEERQLNRAYDDVYGLFEAGQYQEALSNAQANVSRLFGQHPLKPRYALLMAMCTGNTQGKEAYIADLQRVIATYPDTPEETRAKEILRLLGGAGASLPGQAEEEAATDFSINDSELHYIIVVFNGSEIDLNANKITVSDYNQQYHSLDRLRISNVYLGEDNDIPVLVLRRFKDKETAMNYYNGVQANIGDFIDPSSVPYDIFAITQSNYREVLRNRTPAGYKGFFEANY